MGNMYLTAYQVRYCAELSGLGWERFHTNDPERNGSLCAQADVPSPFGKVTLSWLCESNGSCAMIKDGAIVVKLDLDADERYTPAELYTRMVGAIVW